jgi:hypothetical protein
MHVKWSLTNSITNNQHGWIINLVGEYRRSNILSRLAKLPVRCNGTIIYYTTGDDSGSIIERRVGIAATARWLKPAACMVAPAARVCGASGMAATIQTWPALHYDKVDNIVPLLLWWRGHGPRATVEITSNLDDTISDWEEWCAYRKHDLCYRCKRQRSG